MKSNTPASVWTFSCLSLLGALALVTAGCEDSGGGGDPADEEPAAEAEADAEATADADLEVVIEKEEGTNLLTGCDPEPEAGTLWALTAPDRDSGDEVRMCNYRGGVVLIVNTAAS